MVYCTRWYLIALGNKVYMVSEVFVPPTTIAYMYNFIAIYIVNVGVVLISGISPNCLCLRRNCFRQHNDNLGMKFPLQDTILCFTIKLSIKGYYTMYISHVTSISVTCKHVFWWSQEVKVYTLVHSYLELGHHSKKSQ